MDQRPTEDTLLIPVHHHRKTEFLVGIIIAGLVITAVVYGLPLLSNNPSNSCPPPLIGSDSNHCSLPSPPPQPQRHLYPVIGLSGQWAFKESLNFTRVFFNATAKDDFRTSAIEMSCDHFYLYCRLVLPIFNPGSETPARVWPTRNMSLPINVTITVTAYSINILHVTFTHNYQLQLRWFSTNESYNTPDTCVDLAYDYYEYNGYYIYPDCITGTLGNS